MMEEPTLPAVRFVLVETSHPGNIGASARALKTMGFSELCLVRPRDYPSAEATARASGADDLLAAARVCEDLDEALGDCRLVIGTSGRERSLRWPQLDPRAAAAQLQARAAQGPVALLFGPERTGLENDALDRCQYLVRIPTAASYGSLNLAAAVQILAYELRMLALGEGTARADLGEPSAPVAAVEGFYGHLERVLLELGFLDPDNPRHLMRRLRRLFGRVELTESEVAVLRGVLAAAEGRKLPRR